MRVKNMFNILWMSIFLIILVAPFTSATTWTVTSASLRVTSLKYEPYPVEPGSYFKMWIKLENVGVDRGRNVSFELLPEFPFSLDSNQNALKSIGKLDVGDEVVLEYKIRVDKNAVVGENDLKSKYCTDKDFCVTHDFNVSVQARDAIITLADVYAEPSQIAPGQEAFVKIKLNNNADSLMKDIRVKLNLLEAVTTTTSVTYRDLPFTPIGSTNEIALEKLDRGEEKEIVFKVIADPDAQPKIYKIPVIVTYADEVGKNYTRNYITALIVNDKPDLYAKVEETTIYRGGGVGVIDIKFINKGLTDIKFLDVQLNESPDYKLLTSDRVYIGNLDSDDYETAEYKLIVKSKAEKVDILMHIKYRDALNNEYEDDIVVPLYLYSSKYNGESKFGFGTVVLILIVAGAAFFFYRRWRKKHKKK